MFITQNSRLNYKEPQTGEISRACSKAAQKEKKATKNGRTFVPFLAFCWDLFKVERMSLWSNEKAQVRPPRLWETERSRANWHGSKASPAAILLALGIKKIL